MKNTENNGEFLPFSKPLKSEFKDDMYWQELCEKTSYVLPKWEAVATPENIRVWLNRLEIREVDYREAMQTSIHDMLRLNPTWPLRAWAGILLEYKYEKATRGRAKITSGNS